MKKVKNILIIFVLTILACVIGSSVNAESTNKVETYKVVKDAVPNSTYIIGTHMFTRATNKSVSYNGQLTTKFIMYASQTINSDNLLDMIIYYKNPRGNWVDAITGRNISVPDSFEISKENLNRYILVPVLEATSFEYSDLNQTEDTYVYIANYKDYYLDETENTYNVDGIEIYKTWVGADGEQRYNEICTLANPDSYYCNLSNIGGYSATLVARAYVLDDGGTKIYSDYSEILDIKHSYQSEKGNMSLEEFKGINNETTLGELKERYNIEPSIANLGDNKTVYLYDFKGRVNRSMGITPNVQFEFTSDKDTATVKAKVYRNLVTDDEIDHSKYDNGNKKIELSDFDSITLSTPEALEELLGTPYMIKTIYERNDSITAYPTTEYAYKIKGSEQIINFSFANNGNTKLITEDYSTTLVTELTGKTFISEDSKHELVFSSFSEGIPNSVRFRIIEASGRSIQSQGEVRATTLEKLQTDYIFRGTPYMSQNITVIGRIRYVGADKIQIDCLVLKKTENEQNCFKDLKIGYNKLEFTLKAE